MPDLLDIVGQAPAVARLQRLYHSPRKGGALCLAGPEGVGRRTTALAYARLRLCEAPRPRPNGRQVPALPEDFALAVSCGVCGSCRAVEAGTHPDCQIVYRQLAAYHDDPKVRDRVMQDLSIDVIRQFLIAPAYRAAGSPRGKVFLVREAELMSGPAQNALLKTLEEPPPQVTILLLASSETDLLPTTRSRCQIVRFGPLPAEFIVGRLAAAGIDAAEGRFWAALTDGSLGRSQRLAGEGLYAVKRQLVEALAALAPRTVAALTDRMLKTLDRLARKRDATVAASLANRQAGQVLLELLAGVYRDVLAVAAGSDRPLCNADQAPAIAAIAARWNAASAADILSHLARYEELLWRNVNPKVLCDNIAVSCLTAEALAI